MTTMVFELFDRFLSQLSTGESASLFADEVVRAERSQVLNAPLCSVLIKARDNQRELPFAIIVFTSPELSTDDTRLLEYAARKARAHKAPYFVTWTMRDACIWSTPKSGTPTTRDTIQKLRDYPDLYEISPTADSLPEPAKLVVLERGRELMRDMERLFRDESLELVEIDATYFVGRLIDAVHRLVPLVSDSLHLRLDSDLQFREEIATWALKQGIAGDPRDVEFAESIARQTVYRLLGKILFYQSLRRSARHLPDLDFREVDSSQVLSSLRMAFARALEIDYHAVFAEDVPDRVQWPAAASGELVNLIHDFHTRDFAHVPQDVIGTVFERLIPPEERHGLGQYFTPESLCDLILAFCVRSSNDKVLDPTCGTGTFLIRAYDRLKSLGEKQHIKLLSQLWGIDIAPFPAELATINLFRQRVAEHRNFPRIVCRDFLSVLPGEHFPFPPPKMELERPERINEQLPSFDAVVGNFPYVSQDQLEKREAGYREVLRKLLVSDWFKDYPDLFFYRNKGIQAAFKKMIASGTLNGYDLDEVQHRISTYADLYVHLFFHASRFLKLGGRMGIVTSNAWLDVNFGYELQRFFLRHFKIVAILESRSEPWFIEASVNTIVTILERCDSAKERDTNLIRFVRVKRPLNELIPGDPIIEAPSRWQHLNKLIHKIERSGAKYAKTYPLELVTEEDDNFRIRVLRQGEIRTEIEREGRTIKWGRYLRAPNVLFALLQRDELCPLSDIAPVSRGSLSGLNEFYHLTSEQAAKLGIESEFLQPLLKSPGESDLIPIETSALGLNVFVCRLTKEELRAQGKKGALAYIEWGEKQIFNSGVQRGLTWPHGAEVRVRKPGWYAIPPHRSRPAHVFMASAFGERHIHRFCKKPVIVDKRLYFLSPRTGIGNTLLAAVMNCSLTALITEVIGRVSMGDGVLEITVEDANDYLFVPDIRLTSAAKRKQITEVFKKICSRPIGSVFEEVKKSDRNELDRTVSEAIGLDHAKYLKPLYEGLCELVHERMELGKKRSKERKTRARTGRAEKQVAETVLDEILPEGPKRFPDDFFSIVAARDKRTSVPLPESALHFDSNPFTMGLYTKDRTFSRDAKNPSEAKFLIYAQQAGQKVAELPAKAVEVSRTVANYEKYLRELRVQLYETYYRRTLDHAAAARLTQSAFDRFRLPTVAN